MRILLLHRAFPGQFRYLAPILAKDPHNEVVFLTCAKQGHIPGVRKLVFQPQRAAHPATHPYLQPMESAVLLGQAAAKAAMQLKESGFYPDVIYGHSGWGPTLFMADIFPRAPIVCHFEWFYKAHGSSFGFDPQKPLTADNEAQIRVKNAPILSDLVACVKGICPTQWQHCQFPREFQAKLEIIHEGIHTEFFKPAPQTKLVLPQVDLNLTSASEVVTYVATGMEPLRGFPQFMAAVYEIQQRRPACHIVIVGENRTEYSEASPSGKSYAEEALAKYPFDMSRLHFTGRLSIKDYQSVLQASTVHVYLTYPFILSWSMLEAMSSGCLVIGSDTPPVREIIQDGKNGLLVDFFSPSTIAARVDEALAKPSLMTPLKAQARATILEKYNLNQTLGRQISLLRQAAEGR